MSMKGKVEHSRRNIRAEEDLGGELVSCPGGNWVRLEQILGWQQGPLPSAALQIRWTRQISLIL